MGKVKKEILFLSLIAFLVTFLVWLPFLLGLKEGIFTVFKNYDGPNYIVIAKTWYNQSLIANTFSLPTPLEYYPAHLPGYPFSIFLLDIFLSGPWAMLASSLIFSVLSVISFYLLVYKFKLSQNPFWLSLLFLIFPARWVAVKAVGSPEPMFIFFIISSIYFFKSAFDKVENNLISKRKNVYLDLLLAGVFGGLAQITKSPGILLFVGFEIFLLFKMFKENNKNLSSLTLLNHFIKPTLPL
ncbi:glycosyltransferase family 39 protein, partial [Patescibacteria group bacterium]|nr:glycosyltransferase family 39 protein [Patescibacteria group bacterium]